MQRYDIVIHGFDREADPVEGLTRVFGVDVATARSIVQRVPLVVKHNVTLEAAQPFEVALLAIGAHVQLRGIGPALVESVAQPTMIDGTQRGRRHAHVETSLMHGAGWEHEGDVEHMPRTSLPVPPPAPPPPPEVAASIAPPAWSDATYAPPPRLIVAPGAQLFEPGPKSDHPLDIALDDSPQGWSRSSKPPPPIDPQQRATRFAEDLVLPWVGTSSEPPRPQSPQASPSQRPARGPR